jgi:Lrp/AsnC family transcriptional regulator, leucine-responsive regulatory protein
MDAIDQTLLARLTADGRATLSSLAAAVSLSVPSTHDRLRKLESGGVIRGYAATLEPEAVGRGTAAFVALSLGAGPIEKERIDRALEKEPAVVEAHEVAGEDCYLLKLRVESASALSEALARLRRIHPKATTRTTMVLRTALERPLAPALPPEEPTRPRRRTARKPQV